jgi:hypothetical protein
MDSIDSPTSYLASSNCDIMMLNILELTSAYFQCENLAYELQVVGSCTQLFHHHSRCIISLLAILHFEGVKTEAFVVVRKIELS